MKGPSLKKQYEKMLKCNYRANKKIFNVKEHVRFSPEFPGLKGYLGYQIITIRNGEWQLIIADNEQFEKCCKIPMKNLKCKNCRKCGLYDIRGCCSITCDLIQQLTIE